MPKQAKSPQDKRRRDMDTQERAAILYLLCVQGMSKEEVMEQRDRPESTIDNLYRVFTKGLYSLDPRESGGICLLTYTSAIERLTNMCEKAGRPFPSGVVRNPSPHEVVPRASSGNGGALTLALGESGECNSLFRRIDLLIGVLEALVSRLDAGITRRQMTGPMAVVDEDN